MKHHRSFGRRNRPALVVASAAVIIALCAFGARHGAAQSEQAERQLEDRIPKHLPIKIKVKNLGSARWERDLEVEVKNVSEKPIYYLRFGLAMPEVKSEGGHPMGFVLRYGRHELALIDEPPCPEDVPILPGESYTLKIPRRK